MDPICPESKSKVCYWSCV